MAASSEKSRVAASDEKGRCRIVSVTPTKDKSKNILSSMNIDFPEGTVTAILGPSGAGKTTLLNFITNNIPSNLSATGEVTLSGTDAFVPQDDRLHGFYTCVGYLRHYARLSGLTINEETNKRIYQLLADVGLTGQKNTIVGDIFLKGLSGGQQRRLSIALEALTRPQNFFLDEPTSGLDAESALQVMRFLKTYASAAPGRRIIITIHQPSSFIWKLIDNIVLVSKGKLMYQGSRAQMEQFFTFAGFPTPKDYNPADHYVTAVNDEFQNHDMEVDEWATKYLEFAATRPTTNASGGENQEPPATSELVLEGTEEEDGKTNRAGPVTSAIELTKRYFNNLIFNPGILGTRIAMYFMLALMVGLLFNGVGDRYDYSSITSRTAISFYCVAFFIFMSIAVMPFTVLERGIVDKEVLNSYYNPVAYQLAQAVSSIPGTALLALIVSGIVIGMAGLRDFWWYFLDMFLSLVCAEALAQLVSHVVPHFVIGMALVAGMYGFFMLFMGFMLIPSDFPSWLKWTNKIGMHTYAWRTFMYTEFCCEDQIYDTADGAVGFATGLDVLEFYEIQDVNRGNDMIVLACYALILHLMSCAVLHIRYSAFKGKIVPAVASLNK